MEIPNGVEIEILEYFRLELAEEVGDKVCLELDDIAYDGIYEIAGACDLISQAL